VVKTEGVVRKYDWGNGQNRSISIELEYSGKVHVYRYEGWAA